MVSWSMDRRTIFVRPDFLFIKFIIILKYIYYIDCLDFLGMVLRLKIFKEYLWISLGIILDSWKIFAYYA